MSGTGKGSWEAHPRGLELDMVSQTYPSILPKRKLRSQRLSNLPKFAGLVLVQGGAHNPWLLGNALSLPSTQTGGALSNSRVELQGSG